MELGLASFADLSSGVSPQQRIADLLEEVSLADELGLDVFGIGEHHRPDFAVSAPAVVLAAAAARTSKIRLSSAVTVLAPVSALAAKTGRQIWRYTRQQPVRNAYENNRYNRGVAILGNRLFVGTLDAANRAGRSGAVLTFSLPLGSDNGR